PSIVHVVVTIVDEFAESGPRPSPRTAATLETERTREAPGIAEREVETDEHARARGDVRVDDAGEMRGGERARRRVQGLLDRERPAVASRRGHPDAVGPSRRHAGAPPAHHEIGTDPPNQPARSRTAWAPRPHARGLPPP